MGSNTVQACIFSGFNFTTAQVVCITAIINHVLIMFSLFAAADTLLSVRCFKNVKECQKNMLIFSHSISDYGYH